jgi:hypothetical protein
MKTKEETISENIQSYCANGTEQGRAYAMGFNQGVEYAEKWHSVENELPKESSDIPYFVKTNDGCATGIYFDKIWEIDSWLINLNQSPVTHWRLIEH